MEPGNEAICLTLIFTFCLSLGQFIDTERKHYNDTDDDSGMGPSTFVDTKSSTFSEVNYYSQFIMCSVV